MVAPLPDKRGRPVLVAPAPVAPAAAKPRGIFPATVVAAATVAPVARFAPGSVLVPVFGAAIPFLVAVGAPVSRVASLT